MGTMMPGGRAIARHGILVLRGHPLARLAFRDLGGDYLVVDLTRPEQLLVGANRIDASLVEHDDHVGIHSHGDALRHDEHRRALRRALEMGANLGVGLEVQGRERIVEDVEPRLLGECARYRDALLLSAGQTTASLRDLRFETVGLFHDEVIRRRFARRLDDLIVTGVLVAIANVIGDRPREQRGLLRSIGNERAELRLRNARDVDAIEQDSSVRGVVEALDEVEQVRSCPIPSPR